MVNFICLWTYVTSLIETKLANTYLCTQPSFAAANRTSLFMSIDYLQHILDDLLQEVSSAFYLHDLLEEAHPRNPGSVLVATRRDLCRRLDGRALPTDWLLLLGCPLIWDTMPINLVVCECTVRDLISPVLLLMCSGYVLGRQPTCEPFDCHLTATSSFSFVTRRGGMNKAYNGYDCHVFLRHSSCELKCPWGLLTVVFGCSPVRGRLSE